MKLQKQEGKEGIVIIPENMHELNAINAILEFSRVMLDNNNTYFPAVVSLACENWIDNGGYLDALTGLRIVPVKEEPKPEVIPANESFELIDDKRRR